MAGETILVVDDEANIVELARMYLERARSAADPGGIGASRSGAWPPGVGV